MFVSNKQINIMKKLLLIIAVLAIGFTSCQKEALTDDQERVEFIKSTSFKVIDISPSKSYTVESWDYFYADKLVLVFQSPNDKFSDKYGVGANIKGKELVRDGLVK